MIFYMINMITEGLDISFVNVTKVRASVQELIKDRTAISRDLG